MEQQPKQPAEVMAQAPSPSGQMLEWSASEYVDHEKSSMWFIGLAVVAVALIAFAIFILKQYTFAVLIVVMAIAVGVWAKRPAIEMHYQLDPTTVVVNGKSFPLQSFRGFGVMQDGGLYSVVLLPVRRLVPGVNIYFPHEMGEQIVDILGAVLPMENIQPDFIDRLTSRLKF